MKTGDNVVVVGDGPCKWQKGFFESFGPRVRYFELSSRAYDWGGTPRNVGMKNSTGDYIAFMDDDDVYLEGAFAAMHGAINHYTGRTFLFRMKHLNQVIWKTPEIVVGNVSTQMVLMPNRPGRMPLWKGFYEADVDFIYHLAIAEPLHAPIMWMDSVIAELVKHGKK